MLSCWQLKNSDRPRFSTLSEQLEQHYSNTIESTVESDISNPPLPQLVANAVTEMTYVNYKPE